MNIQTFVIQVCEERVLVALVRSFQANGLPLYTPTSHFRSKISNPT